MQTVIPKKIMSQIVFYSWQSDLPNPTNRTFIEKSLEEAAKAITNDGTVAIEPVIDRDTKGMAGSPDIASTIFAKISAADVFVADISIIGKSRGRCTPNPNVLIELGFALKALGHERVILVFNKAYGKIDQLPFDLRTRRLVIYNMPEEKEERTAERASLKTMLDSAIRTALTATPIAVPSIPAVNAIERGQPDRIIILRRNLEGILENLKSFEPPKYSAGGTADGLIKAIEQTQEPLAEFSKIVETVVVMGDLNSAQEIYWWFGKIFEHYNLPPGYNGSFSSADCDYFKFIGHELFVTLFAFLIREKQWDIISQILDEPIPLKYRPYGQGPGNEYWDFASEHLDLLLDESRKKGRKSIHADILHTRHTDGGLAAVLPYEDFAAADYFLFLYGELSDNTAGGHHHSWRAWSVLYMKHSPMFIHDAEKVNKAEQLAKVFKLSDSTELKKRLVERANKITSLFGNSSHDGPLDDDDINNIATR